MPEFKRHLFEGWNGESKCLFLDYVPATCPLCNKPTDADSVMTRTYGLTTDASAGYEGSEVQIVYKCSRVGCQRLFLTRYIIAPWIVEEVDAIAFDSVFPREKHPEVTELLTDERIPPDVRADLNEAECCFQNQLYQAFGAMARRVVHSICADLRAYDGDLHSQISDLETRQRISAGNAETMHAIRTLGRNGAHPEWEKVTQEMATTGIELLIWLVRDLYATPDVPDWKGEKRYRLDKRRR